VESGRSLHHRNRAPDGPFIAMIAITITPEAYDAIKPRLPETNLAPSKGADGLIRLWLDRKFVDQLAQMRAKGESYSEVILRLAKA
jgi:hypothetical protein